MQPTEIILGAVFILAAVFSILWAFSDESVAGLGAALLLAVVGIGGLYNGEHGEHVKFHAKHQAILGAVREQGFKVASNDVYAVGGNLFWGTEVDVKSGSCVFPLIARRIDGVWRLVLPQDKDAHSVRPITPADVTRLGEVC